MKKLAWLIEMYPLEKSYVLSFLLLQRNGAPPKRATILPQTLRLELAPATPVAAKGADLRDNRGP